MKRLVIAIIPLMFLPLSLVFASDNLGSDHLTPIPTETVVLLHGLGRNNTAMWLLARRLEGNGFAVQRIGYDSLQSTPEQIIKDVNRQIDLCCANLDQPVHFVGHSLGGLLIRAYLKTQRVTHLGSVVLIGTPNKGTPLVDQFKESWWMKLAGPTALALGTDDNDFPRSLPSPDYSLGVIAGITDCSLISLLIPGEDDGLVATASTQIEGMSDYIVVNTSHSMMRYDQEVAQQVSEFLKNGRFSREQ